MFTSPNKMTEQAMTMTQEFLATPEVVGVLGEEAMRLSVQLDQAFVPNNYFGRLSVPRDYRNTDGAAILAVNPTRSLYLGRGFDHFTPGQAAAAEAFIASHDDCPSLSEIEKGLAANRGRKEAMVGTDEDSLASPAMPVEYWPSAANLNVHGKAGKQVITAGPNKGLVTPRVTGAGRPLILLPYGVPGKESTLEHPEATIHELVHARQAIKKPLLWVDPAYGLLLSRGIRNARRELEAYHPDAAVTKLLVDRGERQESHSTRYALQVEAIRQQHAPADDPFYPTMAILDFFGIKFYHDQVGPLREG